MDDRRHDDNDNRDDHGDAPSGMGRRKFIAASAAGTAAAWAVPQIVSMQAAAAGTPPEPAPPIFITGSESTAYSWKDQKTGNYNRSITLNSNPSGGLQAGDIWLAVVAYHINSTIQYQSTGGPVNIEDLPTHDPAFQVWGPNSRNSGTNALYAVRAYVVARVLSASDVASGNYACTFTVTNSDATNGGLRGAVVSFRPVTPVGTIDVQQGNGYGPVGAGHIVTSTFPQASAYPLSAPNKVVRIGVARGYGGWTATDTAINWTGGPATNLVNYNRQPDGSAPTGPPLGDRAIWISAEDDGDGGTKTATWFRQTNVVVITVNTQNWVTFTVTLPA